MSGCRAGGGRDRTGGWMPDPGVQRVRREPGPRFTGPRRLLVGSGVTRASRRPRGRRCGRRRWRRSRWRRRERRCWWRRGGNARRDGRAAGVHQRGGAAGSKAHQRRLRVAGSAVAGQGPRPAPRRHGECRRLRGFRVAHARRAGRESRQPGAARHGREAGRARGLAVVARHTSSTCARRPATSPRSTSTWNSGSPTSAGCRHACSSS